MKFRVINNEPNVDNDFEPYLSITEMIELFKSSVQSEWCYFENDTEFKYAKLEISDLFAHPQVSFLLTLNKMTFQATLQRYGELLDIASLAQNEFDKPMQTLIRKKKKVLTFISILKQISVDRCEQKDVLRICCHMIHHNVVTMEKSSKSQEVSEKQTSALRFVHEQLRMMHENKLRYSPAVIRYKLLNVIS